MSYCSHENFTSSYSSPNSSTEGYIDCNIIAAISKLEQDILHQDIETSEYFLEYLPCYVANKILEDDTNLVDILALKWKRKDSNVRRKFRDAVGSILLSKVRKAKGSFKKYENWYNLDKARAQIIIASSLDNKGHIKDRLFRKRFNVRVKSSLKLSATI